ncbi:MFS transporter [Caballeronia sordidicola]|uniref:MFS transporter n=1 Tax=Caballeronia sordidicola TaxID=196367 RepID=UPI0009DEBF76|nr:MFS transporter [Caballeronia sordidicola]
MTDIASPIANTGESFPRNPSLPDAHTAQRDRADAQHAALVASASRKAMFRILPVLFLGYIFSYLDRTNVGFAALTMNRDLGLTSSEFGWGAGLFFVSYAIAEIPSNFALQRFGARRWLARIMVTWGILSTCTAFVVGPHSFYGLRFILGIAEAGFFPGVVLYLSDWFPRAYRGRVVGWFTLGVPISAIIGGPLSGALMQIHSFAGLSGWKWLFIAQGLPAAILGVIALFLLTDKPDDARWLSAEEKEALRVQLNSEVVENSPHNFVAALKDPRVLLLTLLLFTLLVGSIGLGIWLPQIIHREGVPIFITGLMSTIPYIAAAVGMIALARVMDRRGNYVGMLAVMSVVATIGFVLSTLSPSVWVALAGVSVAMIGVNAARTALWSLPSTFLSGSAAVGGIAFINAISNFAGIASPAMIGAIKQWTGSFTMALLAMAASLLVTAIGAVALGMLLKRQARQAHKVL